MDDKDIYENMRQHIGNEGKETIWENARLIYEQRCDKKYLSYFSNQQEFAEFLGISRGRISQYRYAYEYYLLYKSKIDLRKFTVEQAYLFYRYLGSLLFDFLKWAEEQKKISCEKASLRETKKLVEEYIDFKRGIEKDDLLNSICIEQLTEHEKKIIAFYRTGNEEQRRKIDLIIEKKQI